MQKILIALILSMALASCSKEQEAEPLLTQQVIVLFAPGGVGDMAYNDQILRGVQRVKKAKDFKLLISSPSSVVEAEKIFTDWLNMNTEGKKSLFVLAGNEYEEMAVRHLSIDKYPNKEVLLFETRTKNIPAYTFSITMYGAC